MYQYAKSQIAQVIVNPLLNEEIQTQEGGISFIQRLLPALVSLGFVIGAVVFFFILLTGAIQWMTSGGDKGATETARKRLTNAFIGLIILFSLFAIINLIESFLDVNLTLINIDFLNIGSGGGGGGGTSGGNI